MAVCVPSRPPRASVRPLSLVPKAVPPARPVNEEARLAALHSLDILDTAADRRFDRLTALAADLFQVSAALVSLVDENRQWFKSTCNLDAKETSRDISFCGHAILEEKLLVIDDALLDPRFSRNPLVLGAPHIRFYAGAVLRNASMQPLGTLCIIDQAPRTFRRVDRRRLLALAELVEQEIDHHYDVIQLRKLMERLGC
ncbi:MAG: GAF domain-containing protein [Polyangiaceae bacterium]|nr:GAF domain-containing protein [Polyangiaceae bacterium]